MARQHSPQLPATRSAPANRRENWRSCLPRRRRTAALLSALAVVALSGCSRGAPPRNSERSGRLPVVTTILPITLFTRTVAGDCAVVTPLIPATTAPHAFQARPADLLALRRARLLVINGLGMETFLQRLIRAADNPELQLIDASHQVRPITGDASAHAGHNHGGDAHGSHDRAAGTEAAVNPHVWLDPLRAVQQLEAIRDGLIQADPSCADGYRRRAAAGIAQLRGLHREIAGQLAPYRGRSFVAFHAVAPYFAERYGLRADDLVDVPELDPSPRDLRRVAALVRRSQLRALLSEPQQGERSFNALARDLGVRLSVFDPLETSSAQGPLDLSTYLSVMRRNTADLRQAFGEAKPKPPASQP